MRRDIIEHYLVIFMDEMEKKTGPPVDTKSIKIHAPENRTPEIATQEMHFPGLPPESLRDYSQAGTKQRHYVLRSGLRLSRLQEKSIE